MALDFDSAICKTCSASEAYSHSYCGTPDAVDNCEIYKIDSDTLENQAHGSCNLRRGFGCSLFKKINR